MRRLILPLFAIFPILTIQASSNAQVDEPQDDQPQAEREGRRERRGGFDERRRQRGSFFRNMMDATPEERRQMRMDGWLDMVARTYELTDEQRGPVREEIVKMSDEYRQSLGDDGARLEALQEEMHQYWVQRMRNDDGEEDRGAPMRDEKFRELAEEMRDIQRRHPFDFEANAERIEKLLPPEQVEIGRKRRAEWMERRQQWQERRGDNERPGRRDRGRERDASPEDLQRRAEMMRERIEGVRARAAELDERIANFEGSDEDRRRLEQERAQLSRAENFMNDAIQRAEDARRSAETAKPETPPETPRPEARPPTPATPPAPVHPWETYTREFIASKKLSPDQASSAMAILKRQLEREETILRTQASAREAAESLKDAKARAEKTAALQKPIDDAFADLKKRLEALLTVEQRGKSAAR
jgi:hypothetical protein